MASNAPPMLQAGTRLGGYAVIELVGRGGMGEVYRARQLSMEREVALKVLSPRLVRQDPGFAAKFVAEARAAGRLNHPNIVSVHDVATAPAPDGCQGMEPGETINFFSMEFITGETVRDVIERQGAIEIEIVSRVMIGMAEALSFAEANRIVHRDIKPDNIMLPASGGVKLADLGLALQIGEEDAVLGKDGQGRNKVMGTPLYIAPEQAQARTVDHRSDQYALGATLFHMLTGRPPYTGDNSRAIMRAHCFDPIPDPAQSNPQVPPPWRELCLRLMAKSPDDRFATSSELRAAVKAAVRWRPGPSQRTRVRRTNRSWIGLAVVLAVVLVAMWLVSSIVSRHEAPEVPAAPSAPAPVPPKPAMPKTGEPPKPAPDPAAAARDRAHAALSRLPADAQAALAEVDRLLGDQSLAPARAELQQRRAALAAELERQQRAGAQDALARADREIEAGRLDAARALLEGLPDADWVRERRDAVQARLLAAERAIIGRLSTAIAAAPDAASCDRLAADLAKAQIADGARATLAQNLAARRQALTAPARTQPDAGELWRRLAERIEPLRGAWPYNAIADVAAESARSFSEGDRDTVRALAEVSELAQRAETALRLYVAQTNPKADCRLGSRAGSFVLTRLEKDSIGFRLLDVPAESKADRATAELPWRRLLAAALEGGKGDPRAEAAFLWYWRCADYPAALQRVAEDPAGRAMLAYERRTRPIDVAGSLVRRDDLVSIGYEFAARNREADLLTAWAGEGLSLDPRGLHWDVAKLVTGVAEADLPTVRWKAALKPPVVLEATVTCDSGTELLMVGLATKARLSRIGLNLVNRKAGSIVTKADDPASYQATIPKESLVPLVGQEQRLRLELNPEGKLTASVNDQELPARGTMDQPAGEPVTVVIQARQAKGKGAINVQTLTVTGRP